jgi:hypothetical protein
LIPFQQGFPCRLQTCITNALASESICVYLGCYTWQQNFARSIIAQTMGHAQTIATNAAEYVEICVKLGVDERFFHENQSQLEHAKREEIGYFNKDPATASLERLLPEMITAKKEAIQGSRLPDFFTSSSQLATMTENGRIKYPRPFVVLDTKHHLCITQSDGCNSDSIKSHESDESKSSASDDNFQESDGVSDSDESNVDSNLELKGIEDYADVDINEDTKKLLSLARRRKPLKVTVFPKEAIRDLEHAVQDFPNSNNTFNGVNMNLFSFSCSIS